MAVGDSFQFPDEKDLKPEDEQELEVSVADDEQAPETEVEIIDDTPLDDRGRKPLEREPAEVTDEELAAYSQKVQARIKELSHARHDERRNKEAVQREAEETQRVARALLEENKRLKTYVNTGQKVYQTTLTASAEAKLEIAKRKYKEAHEAYDSDAMLEAQQELTEAQLDVARAKNFRPTPLQASEEVVSSNTTDQAPPKPDDKTLRWQQRNQWFGQDDEMTALALIQHKKLVSSGIDPRSDEYFSQIDTRMRKRFPEFFGDTKRTPPESRRPANVVAPATRSNGAKKITLTKSQAALAKKFGLTNEQYAASVIELEAQDARQ